MRWPIEQLELNIVAADKHMTIECSPPGAVSEVVQVNDDVLYRSKESSVDSELEFTLHKLLTQDCEGSEHDPLGFAIEKAIAEMEFPELLGDSTMDTSTPHLDSKMMKGQEHLTVEHILADNSLKPASSQHLRKRQFAGSEDHELAGNKKPKSSYETLSPESLSPYSDSESQLKHRNPIATSKPGTIPSRISNEGVKSPQLVIEHKQDTMQEVPLPPKLTNEYTMSQVGEMKKRIINTHKLMLNFNFLKDGYSRSCTELKRALVKLKQSECHRAQLLNENEKLKKLVLELSQNLEEHD